MMPSSVAMFFMMDQLSLLRPAEDNGAVGPALASACHVSAQNLAVLRGWGRGEGSQPQSAPALRTLVPELQGAAVTAQLLRPGRRGGHRAEPEPSGRGRGAVLR